MAALLVVALWLFLAYACIYEAITEKDWPRDTFPWFAVLNLGLIVCALL